MHPSSHWRSHTQDPPLYFSHILWPSHLKAHAHLFENGDVEAGALRGDAHDDDAEDAEHRPSSSGAHPRPLQVIEAQDPAGKGPPRTMDEIVRDGARVLCQALVRRG